MSRARDRIVEVLLTHIDFLDDVESAADLLMVVVRDTVAEGFETAAIILERPLPDGGPAQLLHEMARQLWVSNNPKED